MNHREFQAAVGTEPCLDMPVGAMVEAQWFALALMDAQWLDTAVELAVRIVLGVS